MDWEVYKTLTKEQKEEYSFRFKNKKTFDLNSTFFWAMFFAMTVTMNMFVFYLVMSDSQFDYLREQIIDLFSVTMNIIRIGLIVLLIDIIIKVFYIITNEYKKYKWIKKNNISHPKSLYNKLRKKRWLK